IAELKWERPIVVGHSASGRLSISFAANFPDKISRLVVVDSGLAREEGGGARPAVGNPPLVFETVEAAMAHFAKLSNPPRISHDRERALAALVKVEKGYMLKRDPDFQNTKPQGEGANLPQRAHRDVWQELAAVKCPTMIVRGLRSDRYTPEIIARISRDYPSIEWATVNSQHDVADQAPQELVAAVRKFSGGAGTMAVGAKPVKIDVEPRWWDNVFAPSSCLVLITTVDRQGTVNAAAFGTCTRVCHEPMYIAFTCSADR